MLLRDILYVKSLRCMSELYSMYAKLCVGKCVGKMLFIIPEMLSLFVDFVG